MLLMKLRQITRLTFLLAAMAFWGCSERVETVQTSAPPVATSPTPVAEPSPTPSPAVPNLRAALLDERFRSTTSPIGNFDFRNFTYELPRGWQNPDGTAEITLSNGKIAPVSRQISENMADEEKAAAKSQRRIGMSYVIAKYFDVTGDGEDEAIVVLKVETGGSAIPQLVYVFSWKGNGPELIWPFRTGDRADGGLKDLRPENGELVVELYGQDRFILGQTETGKITGDEEQLCCPTSFTRTRYKWNGNTFLMQGKRLTYSMTDSTARPLENYGDIVNNPAKSKK